MPSFNSYLGILIFLLLTSIMVNCNVYQRQIRKSSLLPYDFDMTGWVNPSYATVNTTLGINSVQDRKYRGFKRDQQYFDQVRRAQFIR